MNSQSIFRRVLDFLRPLAFGYGQQSASIHNAAAAGGVATVRTLFDAKPSLVNAENILGFTPLRLAVQYGHLEVVKLLLDNGAAVDDNAHDGSTPLIIAAAGGYLDVVKLLLEKGANPTAEASGLTPLRYAEAKGHTEIAELLQKANIEFLRVRPIFDAATAGDVASARTQLVADRTLVDARNHAGTPLVVAARQGHLDVVRLLIEKGAELESKNYEGATSLIVAALTGISML